MTTKKKKKRTATKQRDILARNIIELIEKGALLHNSEREDGSCPGCEIDEILRELKLI